MLPKVIHKLTDTITVARKNLLIEWKNISNVERILFLSLLTIFPANLAKHFIFSSSYIRGVLVDYLTVPFYLIEILIFILLLSGLVYKVANCNLKIRYTIFIVPLILLPSLWVADFSIPSLFRFGELTLWSTFSLWVSKSAIWKNHRHFLLRFLSLGACWVSLLAFLQFVLQRNVFGYWFFGEPTIYPSLGGVAKTSFLGRELIRGYGTFAHPNVLGGTLAVFTTWFLSEGLFLPAGIGLLGLFVSFSRLSWVCFLFGITGLLLLRTRKTKWFKISLLSLPIFLFVAVWLFPSLSDLSLLRRVELLQSAGKMAVTSPLFGIGLGLFTQALPSFGIPSGPTLFLQPVHNIFALITAESGILAAIGLVVVLVWALYKLWRRRQFVLLISLFQLIFLGLFDHYLYTLPQGLLLVSLTLGLSFPYSKEDDR